MIKNKLILRYLFWATTFTVMVIIFFHSAQTAEQSSVTSGSVAEKIFEFFSPDFSELDEAEKITIINNSQLIVRKSAHFLVYLVLSVCCFTALCTYDLKRKLVVLYALAISAIYAVSDEVHQLFVKGRACRFTDVLIDSAGALVGILIMLLLLKKYLRK